VKRITSQTTPTPDNAGSRAARTAQFAAMLIAWRKRRSLSRAEAARLLCCSVGTLAKWERRRCLPCGFTLRAIVAAIEGGAL
jgi:DNA-binding transcriptional regulator YiaG